MGIILNTNDICCELEKKITEEIRLCSRLCLASVAVGENYAASKYRVSQKRLSDKLNVEYFPVDLPSDVSFEDFKSKMKSLNENKKITGIIVNKPFPREWLEENVFSLLDISKDLEGVHPYNLGKLFFTRSPDKFVSPTVLSTLELLKYALGDFSALRGKKVTVVGSSLLIGKPLAVILLNNFATVSVTHIATYEQSDLSEYVKIADILISAVGEPGIIKGTWIKPGAIVIDIGTSEKEGKLTGDVEFESAKEKAAAITPVPGGVGKLTTLFLFRNLIFAGRGKQ